MNTAGSGLRANCWHLLKCFASTFVLMLIARRDRHFKELSKKTLTMHIQIHICIKSSELLGKFWVFRRDFKQFYAFFKASDISKACFERGREGEMSRIAVKKPESGDSLSFECR